MARLDGAKLAESMQKYLEEFRKFSKENPEEAKKISRARLIKMGLIEDNKTES